MARHGDDSWNINESVGATALGTAAVRAFEGMRESPLFTDPFAQRFLDAAAQRGDADNYGGRKPEEFADSDPALADFVQTMTGFAASRTKYFDDFFDTAAGAGVRQFVILAAGLDTRAWRLAALAGAIVYEIDQPGVLEFKAEVLADPGVTAVATHVAVPIDLRLDWPAALRAAGFHDSEPTGWSVEGLLPYLPPVAQSALFEYICGLSAPGSRLVVDAYRPEFYGEATLRSSFAQMDKAARSGAAGESAEPIYTEELFFTGERADIVEWLTQRGWNATSVPSVDAMAGYGRPPAPSVHAEALSSDFVEARLPS